ncbi:MAG: hypothetical protein QW051_04065 [Candidatus Aenigmatarchaeota archaeon]
MEKMEEKFLRMIVCIYVNSNSGIKFALNNNIVQMIFKLEKDKKIKIIEKGKNFITVKPTFFCYLEYK